MTNYDYLIVGAGLFGASVVFILIAVVGSFGASHIVSWIGLTGTTAEEARR